MYSEIMYNTERVNLCSTVYVAGYGHSKSLSLTISLSVFVSILLIFPCFVVISFGLYYLYNSHFNCFGLCMKMMQWEIEAICNLYELSGESLQCCALQGVFFPVVLFTLNITLCSPASMFVILVWAFYAKLDLPREI